MTTLWDTTGREVIKALGEARRTAGGMISGLALTLVVVADEKKVSEAEIAAGRAASAHPCRVLIVVRRQIDAPQPRLDAEISVGGRLGPGEAVVMRMYGRLALHAESVVLPLLAPDAPVVTWWHGGVAPDVLAEDALSVLAARRITDAAYAEDPRARLQQRADDYHPGDTDLTWTRTTPWRALLAASFDDLAAAPRSAAVKAEAGNASADLLAGWLRTRLDVPVERAESPGPGITEVEVQLAGTDPLRIDRPDGYVATVCGAGLAERKLPLKRRDLGDLIAEELRRLDADQPYAEALSALTGVGSLNDREPLREHVWRDPMAETGPVPA